MLRIFSRFFKKTEQDLEDDSIIDSEEYEEKESEEPKAFVKGGNIAYHPELINELKQEHKKLLNIFSRIQKNSRAGEKKATRDLLDKFKKNLLSHVFKENVKFYVYVKYLLADDPVNKKLAQMMQQEMNGIGKTVLGFIAKSMEKTEQFGPDFQKQLNKIGAVLTERIKTEEERLYRLYIHPDDVKLL